MMDLGGALLGAMAARQRLRLGRALRRACIAAGLLLFAFVLVVIALVLLAWSGFYLLLPQLGPAGAALVVGLIALGLAAIVVAALVWLVWVGTERIPNQLIPVTPHITTLLVLVFAAQRLRMPAADGHPYRKGGSK